MKTATGFLVFGFGLFAMTAQALLFREFLTAFESNDLGVGFFFASWLLWVGVGAFSVYRWKALSPKIGRVQIVSLAYIPAFAIQWAITVHIRVIAGIEPYALFPIGKMLVLSLFVNAPVSLVTGFVFFLACRSFGERDALPVSSVFVLEACGGMAGGLGSTILLGAGMSPATLFFLLCAVCSSFSALLEILERRRWPTLLVPFFFAFLLLLGGGENVMQRARAFQWNRIFPGSSYRGAFQTAQSEYLFGLHQGRWVVVREGSVCESLTRPQDQFRDPISSEIVALHLCHHPKAERILLVGGGLQLGYKFLQLPQVLEVTWTHSDAQYVGQVASWLPPDFRQDESRFLPASEDPRKILARRKGAFDIVVLKMPPATSSVLNRYYTREFFVQVKESLAPDGILGVSVAGGENVIGAELSGIGASLKYTIGKVFEHVALKPGEETWFIASRSPLSSESVILTRRFSDIPGADSIFPPSAISSLYPPDRVENATVIYDNPDLPQEMLLNRDDRPLAHLYHLLLLARHSGLSLFLPVKALALAGIFPFLFPLLVFLLLRTLYLAKGRFFVQPGEKIDGSTDIFQSLFLVFSMGWVSIASMVLLMYLYQTRSGSLYLDVGLVSAIFMAGLSAGGKGSQWLLWKGGNPLCLIGLVFALHLASLVAIASVPLEAWSFVGFAISFAISGACCGSYFPIAATRMQGNGVEAGETASKLEMADHIGAAIGGVMTSMLMIPAIGTRGSFFFLCALILCNLPEFLLFPHFFRVRKKNSAWKKGAYALLGISISWVAVSNSLYRAHVEGFPTLPDSETAALARGLRIEKKTHFLSDGKTVVYARLYDSHRLEGYVFSTQDFAPDVSGYGGAMNLAVRIDASGTIHSFHPVRSLETPAYLALLEKWTDRLKGRNLFRPLPFLSVETVTGATITSRAMLSALEKAGQNFGEKMGAGNALSSSGETGWREALPTPEGAYLAIAFATALLVIRFGEKWSRLFFLLVGFGVGGIALNAQFSIAHVAGFLSTNWPAFSISGPFLLMVGVPLMTALFGNVYCGHLCPFGALQEFCDFLLPRKAKGPVSPKAVNKAKAIKYAMLFLFVLFFFLSRDPVTLETDPLARIFSRTRDIGGTTLAIVAGVGALFYFRFWCQYLCPTGAFLSLLGSLPLLRRFVPDKTFSPCPFFLPRRTGLDCLCCERCRHSSFRDSKSDAASQWGKTISAAFFPFVVGLAVFFAAVTTKNFVGAMASVRGRSVERSLQGTGTPRDVDPALIRKLIRENKLSDQEAWFYKKSAEAGK